MTDDFELVRGSGNVYARLGRPNAGSSRRGRSSPPRSFAISRRPEPLDARRREADRRVAFRVFAHPQCATAVVSHSIA